MWGGQSLSLLMSGATTISLSVWVFTETGSATLLATVAAVKAATSIYVSPIVGQLADRLPRKRLILVADALLAVCSGLLLLATVAGPSWLPAILVIVAFTGAVDSLLLVSLSASVRDVRPEANLTRANGVISFLEASPRVVAPVLGALLLQVFGIGVVLALDIASYVIAGVLTAIARWSSSRDPVERRGTRHPFAGALDGMRVILSDRPFARLQLVFAGVNAVTGLGVAAVSAFLLAHPSGGTEVLGAYNSSSAAGMLVGSLTVAALGARLSRRYAVTGGLALSAIAGRVGFALVGLPVLWFLSGAVRSVGIQVSNAPLTALWQEQTAREDQGKVFGARHLLGQGTYPVALLAGGFLADVALAGGGAGGVAALLLALGVVELGLAAFLHLSGTVRTIASREGTFLAMPTQPVSRRGTTGE